MCDGKLDLDPGGLFCCPGSIANDCCNNNCIHVVVVFLSVFERFSVDRENAAKMIV